MQITRTNAIYLRSTRWTKGFTFVAGSTDRFVVAAVGIDIGSGDCWAFVWSPSISLRIVFSMS